jgi:hydroxyacylglutathione hydrolase
MSREIINAGSMGVNCYLIKADDCYILIDTGFSFRRRAIQREIENAGCEPGNLKLIIITHGDSDHTGNAVYLRDRYGVKIAMHRAESEATEKGNMRLSRKMSKKSTRILSGIIFNLPLARLGKSDRFKPDIYIEDNYDFSEYGLDARALHIPGHSRGSIGVLTAEGDLFCGDLLKSNGKPDRNSLVDDLSEMNASIERLRGMNVGTVYPGHGRPFEMARFLEGYQG